VTSKVEWILLDFGNVICGYDFEPFTRFLVENGPFPPGEVNEKVFGRNGLLKAYETGSISTREFLGRTRRSVAPKARLQQIEAEFTHIHEEWPSAIGVLPLLARRFRLALISDTNELHFGHMIAPIVTPYFTLLILSFLTGKMKPDAAVFHEFLGSSRARPEACLFFDDFEPNAEGARRVGIASHTVSGPLGLNRACQRLGLV